MIKEILEREYELKERLRGIGNADDVVALWSVGLTSARKLFTSHIR